MACSQKEYAKRYDRVAHRLYHNAVYLTGDAWQARRAVAACFVNGFDLQDDLQSDAAFSMMMHQLLLEALSGAPKRMGEHYSSRLHDSLSPAVPDRRLCQLLCDLPPYCRAIVLLCFVEKLPVQQVATLLNASQHEIANAIESVCGVLRRGKVSL